MARIFAKYSPMQVSPVQVSPVQESIAHIFTVNVYTVQIHTEKSSDVHVYSLQLSCVHCILYKWPGVHCTVYIRPQYRCPAALAAHLVPPRPPIVRLTAGRVLAVTRVERVVPRPAEFTDVTLLSNDEQLRNTWRWAPCHWCRGTPGIWGENANRFLHQDELSTASGWHNIYVVLQCIDLQCYEYIL